MPNSDNSTQRRHLIIAGTGRAGTTFLVRYLSELGLDTHLTRHGAAARFDELAQAGLEDFPFGPDAKNLPYVIKNPMLYEFIDQMIADETIVIDGVIIPMRDLQEATESRAILERRAMYASMPWLGSMDKPWETAGNVPGGLIHSLNAMDEARLLATGFHLLIERLVRAGIPFVLIDFPRIVNDADYLYDQLATVVPSMPDREGANAAHGRIARPELIRVKANRVPADEERLDTEAVRRELVRLQGELIPLRDALATSTAERDATQLAAQSLQSELVRVQELFEAARSALELAERQRDLYDPVIREVEASRSKINDLESLRERAWKDGTRLQAELDRAVDQLESLLPEHERLKSRSVLLGAEFEVVMAERAALEAYCRRVERDADAARTRAIAAERSLHAYLSKTAGANGVLATEVDHLRQLRAKAERYESLLVQLEVTNQDLAATMLAVPPRIEEAPPLDPGPGSEERAAPLQFFKRIRDSLAAAMSSG
jgi:hypothetical protein